jgi:hypothetical protein
MSLMVSRYSQIAPGYDCPGADVCFSATGYSLSGSAIARRSHHGELRHAQSSEYAGGFAPGVPVRRLKPATGRPFLLRHFDAVPAAARLPGLSAQLLRNERLAPSTNALGTTSRAHSHKGRASPLRLVRTLDRETHGACCTARRSSQNGYRSPIPNSRGPRRSDVARACGFPVPNHSSGSKNQTIELR